MGEGGGGLGGGLWGVDHKILRGNMRRISRCQQRIWGGGLWEIDYKSTTNEGEGDCKNITEPYKGIR